MTIVLYGALLALMTVGLLLFVNRPQLIAINAAIPGDFPAEGFSHDPFEGLLQKYVDDEGNIGYAAWHANVADRDRLDGYLAAVARFSPEETPARFATRADRLAYWLYAYNAYVIRSVLDHWPIDSVTDVKAPLEAVTGLGFFYRQRFLFGGDALSLYAVEHNKILDEFKDPRVHFVLNCASESCPVLRPSLPVGAELESLLVDATQEFVHDRRNVLVDHQSGRIVLSTIFKWYRKDFLNELRRMGLPGENGVIDYLQTVGNSQLRADLSRAVSYELVYSDYDWTLNDRGED